MPKIRNDQVFKRVSVALNEETYEGVKALAAVSADSLTDYIAGVLMEQVAKNQTIVQQVKLARRAYQDSILKTAEETKKTAD